MAMLQLRVTAAAPAPWQQPTLLNGPLVACHCVVRQLPRTPSVADDEGLAIVGGPEITAAAQEEVADLRSHQGSRKRQSGGGTVSSKAGPGTHTSAATGHST